MYAFVLVISRMSFMLFTAKKKLLESVRHMHSEAADSVGNVKYNRNSLWTSCNGILVTGVVLRASLECFLYL